MVSSKWLKKVKKELAASPAKAGALAVGLLIAGFFWAPLISKWTRKTRESDPAGTANSQSEVALDGSTGVRTENAAGKPSLDTLLALWNARKDDPRCQSVSWSKERSPFVATRRETTRQQSPGDNGDKRNIETEKRIARTIPSDWRLSATTCGARKKLAQINGHVYGEGATLATATGDLFVLETIEPRRVVLRGGEDAFELSIPQ